MTTKIPTGLLVLLLLAGASLLAGCGRVQDTGKNQPAAAPAASPAPAQPRARYDCLIIRNLTGVDDVVVTKGFPEYYAVDHEPERAEAAAKPSASRTAQLMGTEVTIAVYGVDPAIGDNAVAAALGRIAELSKRFNNFDPASDVSRINRDAARAPVKVDSDMAELLDRSIFVSRLSLGAFDVTVGPVTDLWRACRKEGRVPSPEEIARAKDLVGWDKLNREFVDQRSLRIGAIGFKRDGMSLDFGAIAKGFGSEEAAKVLVRLGIRSAVISSGGNIKLIGRRPAGTAFHVGIADPRGGELSPLRFVVFLSDACIDTSGNYLQYTMIGGKRYSHIVDPHTGEAIEALPSVTVVGPDAAMCDALSTAIGVLGVDEGLKLIERVNARQPDVDMPK